MVGYFDDKGNPIVKITIGGRRLAQETEAFLDTGCSGYLVLPISIAIHLGLELIGIQGVEYADGKVINELVYEVVVDMNGVKKTVPATLTWGGRALAGRSLFNDYSININFRNKRIEISKSAEGE